MNANRSDPNTFATGGVTEFEQTQQAVPTNLNSTVALQGSVTADAPHLVINLDTTGRSDINVRYTLCDIDGSADNAQQQVALQYRVGNTGIYTNVPAGYLADATPTPRPDQTLPCGRHPSARSCHKTPATRRSSRCAS